MDGWMKFDEPPEKYREHLRSPVNLENRIIFYELIPFYDRRCFDVQQKKSNRELVSQIIKKVPERLRVEVFLTGF